MTRGRLYPEPGYRFDQIVPGSRLTLVRVAPRFEPTPSQVAIGSPGSRRVVVQCDCGSPEFAVRFSSVCGSTQSGGTVSCGCVQREVVRGMTPEKRREVTRAAVAARYPDGHGLSRHPLYHTWYLMVDRCTNPRSKDWLRYGGRAVSIRVCDRWNPDVVGQNLAIQLFISDIESYLGSRPEGMTLDRICNAHDYRLDNVRWADDATQASNRGPALVGEVPPPHGYCTD